RRELHSLVLTQWLQERMGKGIGALIQLGPFTKACPGKLDVAHPSIVLTRLDDDQALPLGRTQQAAGIPGIEPKPTSKFPNGGSLSADLPQQPCLTKGMVATQEVVV